MPLPQVNAALLSIRETGGAEDWDTPAGASGPVVWQGSSPADAYVMEKIRTNYSSQEGGLARTKRVTIIIPADLVDAANDALAIKTGQIVQYIFRGTTFNRRIYEYAAPDLPGQGVAEYVKLEMDPEPVEATLDEE